MPAFSSSILSLLLLPICLSVVAASLPDIPPQAKSNPSCRFSPSYSQESLLANPQLYISDLLYWEGRFHADGIGYNATNGLTYDGTLLDPVTGLAAVNGRHEFSAASKESLHIMVLTHALAGSSKAARFLSPSDPSAAPGIAYRILKQKLASYTAFNASFPGYGGFLPWYAQGGPGSGLAPTWDWVNRVPALDNGEMIWAVYGAVEVLNSSAAAGKPGTQGWAELAHGLQAWLDWTKVNAVRIFYNGTGQVCTVTDIKNDTWDVHAVGQTYGCEGTGRLDDPFEGELFTWWLYFFGGLPEADRQALWEYKRPQLRNVEYKQGGVGPITVQQGFWFSAHETWKVLEMPYYDVALVRRLFHNAERVRTCNSVINGYDGMFASVNNVTDSTGQIIGYISDAGIPSISNQTTFEFDVVTPYSVFPTLLFNHSVGLAWWKNMVDGKGMQNPYGSTESTRQDGTAISSFVSWDSKITTVNGLLGGVSKFVKQKMKRDGIYNEFIQITRREYGLKFNVYKLKGEDVELCFPIRKVPIVGVKDYMDCSA